jgi:hypothetical protein
MEEFLQALKLLVLGQRLLKLLEALLNLNLTSVFLRGL